MSAHRTGGCGMVTGQMMLINGKPDGSPGVVHQAPGLVDDFGESAACSVSVLILDCLQHARAFRTILPSCDEDQGVGGMPSSRFLFRNRSINRPVFVQDRARIKEFTESTLENDLAIWKKQRQTAARTTSVSRGNWARCIRVHVIDLFSLPGSSQAALFE